MNNPTQHRNWIPGIRSQASRAALALEIMLVLAVLATGSAQAQAFNTLVSFNGTDGDYLQTALVQGIDGNFYGTASGGGAGAYIFGGGGTVFKITPGGALTTLYSFCSQSNCTDGVMPYAGLVQAANGDLYGTTPYGGTGGNCWNAYACGTVFQITPAGALTSLYNFCSQTNCADGAEPFGGVVQGTDGNFYGTTYTGGANNAGTVFKITPSGTLTTLYNFCSQSGCTDGASPMAGLIQAIDGNFYGTTGSGTVFKITPAGTLTTLAVVGSPGSVVQGIDGNFYGTSPGQGIFKVTPEGVVTRFSSPCCWLYGGLVQATNGNFYGATYLGGADGNGTLYEITPAGALTTLFNFCSQNNCTDGLGPLASLMQATNGILYGTTSYGGAYGDGAVFTLSVGLGPFVKTRPALGNVGAAVVILGNNLTGTSGVSFNGTAASFEVASGSEITTTVPPGATTGYVTVATPSGVLASNVAFQVGTGAPTTTTLTSSPNPYPSGQSVTFTATVTPQGTGTPTGTVTFNYGGTTLCSAVTLSGGMAACSYSVLTPGSDFVTAAYSGDTNFGGSSAGLTQVVLAAGGVDFVESNVLVMSGRPDSGSSLTVTDTVINQGNGNAAPTSTWFYLTSSATAQSGTYLGSRSVPALAAGASNTATTQLTMTAGIGGTYYIVACANSGYTPIPESNRTNNCSASPANFPVATADLDETAVSVSGSFVSGGVIQVTDTVSNLLGVTPVSTTWFYLATSATAQSGAYLGMRSVPSLAAGANNTATTSLTLPAGIGGTYYIIACANAGYSPFTETNRTNNCFGSAAITVASADLDETAVSVTGSLVSGGVIQVTDSVSNLVGVTPISATWFYLTTSATAQSGYYLGSRSVPSLTAPNSSTATTSLTLPSSVTGTYNIVACANAGYSPFTESNRANNCLGSAALAIIP